MLTAASWHTGGPRSEAHRVIHNDPDSAWLMWQMRSQLKSYFILSLHGQTVNPLKQFATLPYLPSHDKWKFLKLIFLLLLLHLHLRPLRSPPQSQLLQERRPGHAASEMDATGGLHGGDLHLQD